MDDWIARTKRRHQLCLNWQSDGAVALAFSAPTGIKRDWTHWFRDPQVMLDEELAALENRLAIGSDALPVAFVNFTAAVVFSIFGGRIDFHENGPVYEPLITDWAQLDDLVPPDENAGLLPQIRVTIDQFRVHVPPGVEIVPPYIHTPLNTAALLRGASNFYADLCLEPEKAHRLLALVTEAAALAARHLFDCLGRPITPYTNQVGFFLGDHVHLSDDCCVNLSPAFIEEFDLAYVQRLAERLGADFCTHYCVLPHDPASHCLEPMCACPATPAILNQMTPEFFLENHEQFEGRFALVSQSGPYGRRFGDTPDERLANFRVWAKDFLDRFQGKSGLLMICHAPSVDEAREAFAIWNDLNRWPE
jgi:uroporphyrinogen-III decarboxylase